MLYEIEINNKITKMSIEDIFLFIRNNPKQEIYKIIENEKILINNNIVLNCHFICHRINTISELFEIPLIFGIELDLRDRDNKLILSHDAFIDGADFIEYIDNFHSAETQSDVHVSNRTLILNIKSERIEDKCIEIISQYNISNYFFLDSSIPMIYQRGQKYNFASRFSEIELLENSILQDKYIKWIWVDCFTKYPDNLIDVKKLNKKICLVSPELQNRFDDIKKYRDSLTIEPDAICCKYKNIIYWI